MTDLDMQRRISRLQGSGGKSHQSFLAFFSNSSSFLSRQRPQQPVDDEPVLDQLGDHPGREGLPAGTQDADEAAVDADAGAELKQ